MLDKMKSISNAVPTPTFPEILVTLLSDGEIVKKCYDGNGDIVAFTHSRIMIAQTNRGTTFALSIPYKNLMSVTMLLNRNGKHNGIIVTDFSSNSLEVGFSEPADREDLYKMIFDAIERL